MKLPKFDAASSARFFLFAGPCVIESESHALKCAEVLKGITERLDINFVYKSSFDKANRTSSTSPRGPGREQGLRILEKIRDQLDLAVITDVHSVDDVNSASQVADVIQTPAFLCRQTDLIQAAARCGKPVNIKKGQFLSPNEMIHVANKAKEANANAQIMLCERGSSFGYNNLVVDMRSLEIMKSFGCPVVFDATHSVQLPGAGDGKSSGQREHVPVLAKAATAIGVSGLFMETHTDPANAFSDGPNAWPMDRMENLLRKLIEFDAIAKS